MTPSLGDVQRAFTRICFDETPSESDLRLLHSPPERWLRYRSMVRSRLFGMMRNGLPRTREVLGAARFDRATKRYLAQRGVRSRFIRDVVDELVSFALPEWETDTELPPFIGDLARWEVTKWRVGSLPWLATDDTSEELDFEGAPVHNPTLQELTIRYRVDRRDDRRDEALDEPHRLLVFRKPDDPRSFGFVLDPRATELWDAWKVGDRSFADGVRAVLGARGAEPDATFVDRMAGLLASLVERSIILGSRR